MAEPDMITVWVDTDSGTWGLAEGRLILVKVPTNELEDLDDMTDSERAVWAFSKGELVNPN